MAYRRGSQPPGWRPVPVSGLLETRPHSKWASKASCLGGHSPAPASLPQLHLGSSGIRISMEHWSLVPKKLGKTGLLGPEPSYLSKLIYYCPIIHKNPVNLHSSSALPQGLNVCWAPPSQTHPSHNTTPRPVTASTPSHQILLPPQEGFRHHII